MEQKSNQLESLFRTACEQQAVTPSSRVLRKLRTRLWISDFMSVNPRKVNFVYTALLIGGITSVALLVRPLEKTAEKVQENAVTAVSEEQAQPGILADNTDKSATIGQTRSNENSNNPAGLLKAEFSITEYKGCAPLAVKFTNQSPNGLVSDWDFGTGDKSSERNPVYTYPEAGEYNVILTVKDKDGNTVTAKKKVEVLKRPEANFEIDVENSEIKNKKIILKNNTVGASYYSWDFGDERQTVGNKAEHSYADFGVYKISLVATSDNGCSDTASLTTRFIEKNYELSFPLNFRPNPVERNDGYYEKAGAETSIFYPKNYGAENYRLTIYAQNGLEVFSTNTIKQGWNGYLGAHLAPAGKYTWEASGIYPNGKPFKLKGTVMVKAQEYD